MSNKPISTFLGIAAAAMLASNAHATIINVPADFGTIQAAIADPGTVDGDEIIVDGDGLMLPRKRRATPIRSSTTRSW